MHFNQNIRPTNDRFDALKHVAAFQIAPLPSMPSQLDNFNGHSDRATTTVQIAYSGALYDIIFVLWILKEDASSNTFQIFQPESFSLSIQFGERRSRLERFENKVRRLGS